MKRIIFAAAAMLLPIATPPTAAQAQTAAASPETQADKAAIGAIVDSIRQRQPAEAIARADALIASFDKRFADDRRVIYCARTPTEAILYMGEAAAAKREAIALDDSWSTALFLKAFALIDIGRGEEAKPLLDRALVLSPRNAQFRAELGEWHKSRRQWDDALAAFERAVADATFSPEAAKSFEQGRALRGVGFVLIEKGKLDEAEAMFRQALTLNPNDATAKGELRYIEDQRAKLPRS